MELLLGKAVLAIIITIVAGGGLVMVIGLTRLLRKQRRLRRQIDQQLSRISDEDGPPPRKCTYCGAAAADAEASSCPGCGAPFL